MITECLTPTRFKKGLGSPWSSAGKESACRVGDLGSIPGLGRSPGEGKGYPLQYSGLENAMDCIVHGVAKSWTWLSDFHFIFPCCAVVKNPKEMQPALVFLLGKFHGQRSLAGYSPWGRKDWASEDTCAYTHTFLATLCNMEDLISPPWDRTLSPVLEMQSLSHWTIGPPGKSLGKLYFFYPLYL